MGGTHSTPFVKGSKYIHSVYCAMMYNRLVSLSILHGFELYHMQPFLSLAFTGGSIQNRCAAQHSGGALAIMVPGSTLKLLVLILSTNFSKLALLEKLMHIHGYHKTSKANANKPLELRALIANS